jgi:hypothetical protein
VLLLATGDGKSKAVARPLVDDLDPSCPASAVRLNPHAVVASDRVTAGTRGSGAGPTGGARGLGTAVIGGSLGP